MKKEIADKWIAALRSGEYKQVQAYLHTQAGYCCLGVLCDVISKEFDLGRSWIPSGNNDYFIFKTEVDENYQMLPHSVSRVAGMNNPISRITGDMLRELFPGKSVPAPQYSQYPDSLGKPVYSLAALNDSGLYSFEDIAKIIETYWEQL